MDYTAKTVNLQEAVKDLNARLIKLEATKPVTTIVPPTPVVTPALVVHESPATPAV